MKRFWIILAVVAAAGLLALWSASRRGGASVAANTPPPPPTGDGFQGFLLGNPDAPVEVVEYSDFECPYCARFAVVQMPTIRTQLVETGRVRWRFRDYPLPAHAYARYASHAAHCAGEQGRFWEMHDQLFFHHAWAQTGRDPSRTFREFAAATGLNVEAYDTCMESGRHAGRIEASRLEGEQVGVRGTPTFVVRGRILSGGQTSDDFKRLADSLTRAP